MTARMANRVAPDSVPAVRAGRSLRAGAAGRLMPGLFLCLILTVMAQALQAGEEHLTGHPYVEALVLAILLGTALRTAWVRERASRPESPSRPSRCWRWPSSCSEPR